MTRGVSGRIDKSYQILKLIVNWNLVIPEIYQRYLMTTDQGCLLFPFNLIQVSPER